MVFKFIPIIFTFINLFMVHDSFAAALFNFELQH